MENPRNVYRLISDLVHDRNGARDTLSRSGLERLMELYDLTETQRKALREPGWPSWSSIGLEPISQVLLLLETTPPMKQAFSARKYYERVRGKAEASAPSAPTRG